MGKTLQRLTFGSLAVLALSLSAYVLHQTREFPRIPRGTPTLVENTGLKFVVPTNEPIIVLTTSDERGRKAIAYSPTNSSPEQAVLAATKEATRNGFDLDNTYAIVDSGISSKLQDYTKALDRYLISPDACYSFNPVNSKSVGLKVFKFDLKKSRLEETAKTMIDDKKTTHRFKAEFQRH